MLKFAYQLGFELALQEEIQKEAGLASTVAEGAQKGVGKLMEWANQAKGALGFKPPKDVTDLPIYRNAASTARKAGYQGTGNLKRYSANR